MRPIEFRAWDRQQKKMFSVRGLRMAFGIIEVADAFVSPEWYHVGDNQGDIEIMQFTGLLDSKGQKIYEGDLLQQQLYGGLKSRLQEVFWNEAGFYLRPSTPYGNTPLDAFRASVTEVVGNVWANTDLLAAPPQPVKDKDS